MSHRYTPLRPRPENLQAGRQARDQSDDQLKSCLQQNSIVGYNIMGWVSGWKGRVEALGQWWNDRLGGGGGRNGGPLGFAAILNISTLLPCRIGNAISGLHQSIKGCQHDMPFYNGASEPISR